MRAYIRSWEGRIVLVLTAVALVVAVAAFV